MIEISSPPNPPPVLPEQGDPLVPQFLAGRDAFCPSCGYNLRDLATDQCPECGEAVTLHLKPTGPMTRGRSGLLVLVFLWLLATSSVQGWVVGQSIYSQATSPFFRFFNLNSSTGIVAISPQLNQTVIQLGKSLSDLSSITASPLIDSTSPQDAEPDGESVSPFVAGAPTSPRTLFRSAPEGGSNRSFPFSGGQILTNSGKYNWAAVSWQQWTTAGVWTMLGMMALTGFILLALVRKRSEPSAGLIRTIPILAWSGFGVFCITHLLSSVIGVI